MNDTKKLATKICIDGLEEIILNVLAEAEAKHPEEYVRLQDIRKRSGIEDRLSVKEKKHDLRGQFTRMLLFQLLYKEYAKEGPERGQWKITNKGLQKLSNL